jgi:hypothetical protein
LYNFDDEKMADHQQQQQQRAYGPFGGPEHHPVFPHPRDRRDTAHFVFLDFCFSVGFLAEKLKLERNSKKINWFLDAKK